MGNIPTNNLENIHKLTESEAVTQMGSSAAGLTAAQANTNQGTYGKNVISNKKGKPTILVFLENFVSLMAILLWVGGAIALIAWMPELAVAIWLVNVINGVFSFWQEHRASKATEALKKCSQLMRASFAMDRNSKYQQKILCLVILCSLRKATKFRLMPAF